MANVGTLLLNLTAKTALFDKKIKRSKKNVGMFAKFTKNSLTAVRRSFKVFSAVSVAAFGATSLAVRGAMKDIDKIGKMSSELDISTESLISWEYAAQLTGASLSDLHKGLQIFTRRMGEAKKGYGEGRKGLEALGLEADKIANMRTEDSFILIADAISKIESTTDKVSTAYSIFGRQGIQMLNTLNLGKKGFEDVRKRAEEMGIVLNRLEVAGVENANDRLTDLGKVIKGLIWKLAAGLAPYLEYVVEQFIEWGKQGVISTESIGKGIEKTIRGCKIIAGSFQVLKGATLIITGAVQDLIGVLIGIGSWGAKGLAVVLKLAAAITGLDSIREKANDWDRTGDEWEALANANVEIGREQMKKGWDNIINVNSDLYEKQMEKIIKDIEEKKDEMATKLTSFEDIGIEDPEDSIGKQTRKAEAQITNHKLINIAALNPKNRIEEANKRANERTANAVEKMSVKLAGMEWG